VVNQLSHPSSKEFSEVHSYFKTLTEEKLTIPHLFLCGILLMAMYFQDFSNCSDQIKSNPYSPPTKGALGRLQTTETTVGVHTGR